MSNLKSVPFASHQVADMAEFIGTCESRGYRYEVTQSQEGNVWYVEITGGD